MAPEAGVDPGDRIKNDKKHIYITPFFYGAADCRGIVFSCIDNRTLFSYNEARKEKEAIMQSKAKIVIADDEKEIREVVSMLLTGEGYEVAVAADGREALELADPSVDLYILDVNMPGMTGFAAAAEIRKTCYAPILFLTAYSGESDKMMGFSAGGDDYLVKPFSNVELLLRVRAHLRRNTRRRTRIRSFTRILRWTFAASLSKKEMS